MAQEHVLRWREGEMMAEPAKDVTQISAEDLAALPARAQQAMERARLEFEKAARGITEAFTASLTMTVDAPTVAEQVLAKIERSIRQGSRDVPPKRGSSLPPGARASWRRGTWA